MPSVPETPTVAGYFEETLQVELTRREVYYLRDQIKKKIESAGQALKCLNTHPQKRRARFEECRFLKGIQDRLYGSDPDGAAERAEYREQLRAQAEELEAKAAEFRDMADAMV